MAVPTMPHEYIKAPDSDVSISYTSEPTIETYRFLTQYIAMRIESLDRSADAQSSAVDARARHEAAEAAMRGVGENGGEA